MNICDYVKEQKKFANPDSNWNTIFKTGGYYSVSLYNIANWSEAHLWCQKIIGKDNYSWAGNKFWFETEEKAFLFRLCWG